MAYVSREIKDRVAIGDNCFYMEELEDGRIMLTPAPDSITETGTDINKALLQPIEDGSLNNNNAYNGNNGVRPDLMDNRV